MVDARPLLEAAIADRYAIERELGRGAMATVFLARDLRHRRRVALKVLRPEVSAWLGRERFLREIAVVAQLAHPHVVPLHDSGEAEGLLYYVMPYVEGETLRARLRREGALPLEDTLALACQVADALGYAHARGVVHRDVKPENILLTGGHAVVADFGIASAAGALGQDERITESGLMVGTPTYMSPEQATGAARLDGRSDLYSLGCVVYEMLTGEPPFTGPSPQAVVARHACDPPPPIRTVRPQIPPHVEAAVHRLLAKNPADRFTAASQFIDALDAPVPTPTRSRRSAAALGLAAAAVVGALIVRASEPALRERDWVAVADFVGPPDDPTLADAVRELVTVELDQSRHVSTMPRRQLAGALRNAGLAESTRVSPKLARELAYRSSIRGVLTGSALPLGRAGYSIALRVVDAEDGRDIVSVAGAAGDSNLIPAVQDLARRLRRKLGERRSAIEANRPLADVMTPSFAAYRKYVGALDLVRTGDRIQSNRLLHEAIALDSGFASAWAAMGVNYLDAHLLDSARWALGEALRRPERLTDAQRYRLEADAAYALRHDIAAAIHWYDLYLREMPQSVGGHNNRGIRLSSLGRHAEALEEFRRAVQVNPFGPAEAQIELLNEAAELVVLGRNREARALQDDLEGPFATYLAVLLASAEDHWAAAESLAAPVAEPTTPAFLRIEATTALAAARTRYGGPAQADRVLAEAIGRSRGSEARWYQQARLLLALASGAPLQRPAPDTSTSAMLLTALWNAARGDTAAARRQLAAVERRDSVEVAALGYGPGLVRAWLDVRGRRWRAAIDGLAPAAWDGEHDAASLDRPPSVALRWVVAQAYAGIGMLDSAAAYLERAVAPTGVPPGHVPLRGLIQPYAERRLAEWRAGPDVPRGRTQ